MIYRMGPAPAGTCPRCRETLLAVELGSGALARSHIPRVRWCEKCGGVFADVESSRRIITSFDRALASIAFEAALGKERREESKRTISCPECLLEMVKTPIEAAKCDVDACPSHGTWFDAGELEAVMRAFASARRRGVFVTRAPPGPPAFAVDPEPPQRGLLEELRELVRWLLE